MQAGYRSPIPKRFRWRSWAADPEGITGEELHSFVDDELFPALKNLAATSKSGDRRRVVRDVFEDAYNYMKSGQLMRQVVNKINEVDFNNLTERQHFGDIYEQILNDLQSAGNAGEYYTSPCRHRLHGVTASTPARARPCSIPPAATGGFLTCSLAPHAQALREAAQRRAEHAGGAPRRGEEAASPHALRDQHAAARHRRSELRPPRQHPRPSLHRLGVEGPGRHRPHQPALRRQGGGRHREQLSAAFSVRGRLRICSSPSSSAC